MVARVRGQGPVRTCVSCRRARPRGELVRFVRDADGRIRPDPTGRAQGRGAYACRDRRECLDRATRRLGAALRGEVDGDAIRRMADELGVA